MRQPRGATIRIGALVLVCVLPLAACGDDDTSTVPSPSSSTTASSLPPATVPGGLVAEGSGCTPGPGPLPDGRWYGSVVASGPEQVTFDLACWFTGDAAATAAAEDGEESPPPNDYYVRNVDPTARDVPVSAGASVTYYPTADPVDVEDLTFAQWRARRTERSYQLGVWLTVVEGSVATIEEQWVP